MKKDLEAILDKYIALFDARKLNCAETTLMVMCEYMGVDSPLVPRIATAFGGGLAGTQSVCGVVTGALMAAGIGAGREVGGDQAPARELGGEFISGFVAERGALTCMGLTGVNMRDPVAMEEFRAPGGGHDVICNNCVRWACRYMATKIDQRD